MSMKNEKMKQSAQKPGASAPAPSKPVTKARPKGSSPPPAPIKGGPKPPGK